MHGTLRLLIAALGLALATQAAAQITLYQREGFRGPVFRADGPVWNLDRAGFNDRARSVIIEHGRWEVCDDAHYGGRCAVLRPGSYPSLAEMGLGNRISSVRPIKRRPEYVAEVPPPPPAPVYEYRRRPSEALFQANVTSVHAVYGPPEQRCWIERQQVVERRPDAPNVPGALVGAIIGGVLGHQVGGGRGRDIATAGGAVAGAAIGANVNRGADVAYGQNVQRCTTVPNSGPPAYWEVTYTFHGAEHRAQMSAPPGPTVTVNGRGEPRE
jgi:uncharacterized protein YcfJ